MKIYSKAIVIKDILYCAPEYYSSLRKKFCHTQMSLEDTMLNEISISQKDKYCRVLLT